MVTNYTEIHIKYYDGFQGYSKLTNKSMMKLNFCNYSMMLVEIKKDSQWLNLSK